MGLVTYFSLCLLGCLTYNPSLAAPSLSVEAQAMSCPTGWFSYHDSCYRFFHTKKNWMEAEAHCQHHSHGAHLASIHSAGENKMLAHYIKKYYKENCAIWIGLSDPMEVSARCPLCLGQPLPRPLGSVSLLSEVVWGGGATEQDFHGNGVKRGCNRLGFPSQGRSPAPGAEYELLVLIF
uniref:C-type lectin domain-containing protein n=1 Tax=Chrysemys picta bellii TaxID=8478 RepID=A0A8C3P7D0_CHRPI